MVTKEIVDEILNFEKSLSEKYGCDVKINFTYKKFSLTRIKYCCDRILNELYPGQNDISDKDRSSHMIIFRNCYYAICRDNNYSYMELAEFINLDHSTALYGYDKFNKKYSLGNVFYKKVYNRINDILLTNKT